MINTLGYAEFLSIKHGQDDKPLFGNVLVQRFRFMQTAFVKAMPASSSHEGGEA